MPRVDSGGPVQVFDRKGSSDMDMNHGTRAKKPVNAQKPMGSRPMTGPNTAGVQRKTDAEAIGKKARTKPMKNRFNKSYF